MNILEVSKLLHAHHYEITLNLTDSNIGLTFPNIVENNKKNLVKDHIINIGDGAIIIDGHYFQIPNYAIRQSIVGSIVLQCAKINYNPSLVVFQINGEAVEEQQFLHLLPIKINDEEFAKENKLYEIVAQYVLSKLYEKNSINELKELSRKNDVGEGFSSIVRFLDFFS